jgi:hypothetical protein
LISLKIEIFLKKNLFVKKLNDYVKYQVSEEELAKYKSLLENMAPHQICILEKEIKIL